MLTKQIRLAVVMAAAMSTSALAQEATQVETAEGQTVTVPADAAESDGLSPVATAVVTDFPILNQDMNDQNIADTLLSQGFEDIYILREGSLMTVTATRENNDIKLTYNLVEGRLIDVNGERILTEEERTLGEDGNALGASASSEAASDDGATDGGATDDNVDATSDDGAADDGATDEGGSDDMGADDAGPDDSTADEGGSADAGSDDSGSDAGDSDSGGSEDGGADGSESGGDSTSG